jgi:hypothetical protein
MRKRILLLLALGALVGMVAAATAFASHVRPSAGAQLRVPLVPAYQQCGDNETPNRTHGPALTFPSCNPPKQVSGWLTIGTTDANGFTSQSSGFLKVTVCNNGTTTTGICSTPSGMTAPDVRLELNITDVRCKVGTGGGQSGCEGGQYSDYGGGSQVQGTANIRITDHHNSTVAGGTGDAATVIDVPFPVSAACAFNPAGGTATAIGGTCSTVTRANAVIPGSVVAGKRANVEIGQLVVMDGGQAGIASAPDATTFEVQGIFIP